MQVYHPYMISRCFLVFSSFICASPSVNWVQKPPAKIDGQEEFELAWTVENLDGSFHALCTLCPKDQGPQCKKGAQRYDSEMMSGSGRGEFHTKMSFPSHAPEGPYYATAYGAYSKTKYYNSEAIEVFYHSEKKNISTPSSSESQMNAESSAPNSNVVIMTPPLVPYGYYGAPYAQEENNVTVNNNVDNTHEEAQQHHENQDRNLSQRHSETSSQSLSQGENQMSSAQRQRPQTRQGGHGHNSGHSHGRRS